MNVLEKEQRVVQIRKTHVEAALIQVYQFINYSA